MAELVGTRPEGPLSFREAIQAPCLSCAASPCCTHLLLQEFRLETLMDVDYAGYLLNFDGILLGLDNQGGIDVYFYQSCSNLDVPSGLCTVHGTPDQPAICSHYNGHSCGYRYRMAADVYAQRPMLDRKRLAWLAEHLSFDDARNVLASPPWDQMIEAFHSLPLERRPLPPPPPDPVKEQWRSIVLSSTNGSNGKTMAAHHFTDAVVSNPCQDCGAYCCKNLVFYRGMPGDASQLDFFRYCLGFPSVELGVANDSWAVIVRTTCRHLDGNRCSVFGSEDRPLKCGFMDALKCKHRVYFGTPRPEELVRITRDQFAVLADAVIFDGLGRITSLPSSSVVRDLVESAERARA
jgi:hypothetical protein